MTQTETLSGEVSLLTFLPALGRLAPYLERAWHTAIDALGIESTADDVVTDTRQVLDTAAADQHDGVLLQVVADTGNVGGHLVTVGKTHTGDLTQCGVRLLRGRWYEQRVQTPRFWGEDWSVVAVLQSVQAFLQWQEQVDL